MTVRVCDLTHEFLPSAETQWTIRGSSSLWSMQQRGVELCWNEAMLSRSLCCVGLSEL